MNTQIAFQPENSEETEEIIKLRVELARNKTKLAKYEEILSQLASINLQFSSLLDNMLSNQVLLYSLASQLSIAVIERKHLEKYSEANFKEGVHFLKHIESKREEVLRISEKEGEVLQLVSMKLNDLVRQNSELKERVGETEKRLSECRSHEIIQRQQETQIKLLEEQHKLKEREIEQLRMKIESMEEEQKRVAEKQQAISLRNSQLENELQQKNRELQRHLAGSAEQQSATASKQAILQKCEGLIASVSTAEEQYLTHYLRSNGLSLQVQRPNKNKYAMVFD